MQFGMNWLEKETVKRMGLITAMIGRHFFSAQPFESLLVSFCFCNWPLTGGYYLVIVSNNAGDYSHYFGSYYIKIKKLAHEINSTKHKTVFNRNINFKSIYNFAFSSQKAKITEHKEVEKRENENAVFACHS